MAAARHRGVAAGHRPPRRTACRGLRLLYRPDSPHRHGHPQITAAHLAAALRPAAWDGCDAWFGPADDGGFWALGLAAPAPELLLGVPMSVPETGAVQRRRLVDAGLTVRDLPQLRDVDTAQDAVAVAAAAPHGRFAATLALLTPAQVQ